MFTRHFSNIKGLTLIELLLSITLGLVIMSFLFEIMLAGKQSDRLQTALQQIQVNANKAHYLLRRDIQAAGYIGCHRLSRDFHVLSYPPLSLTVDNQLNSQNENEITIRHASLQSVILKKMTADGMTLYTGAEIKFTDNETVVISDCEKAEIVQIAKINHYKNEQKIITSKPLRQIFLPNAEISKLEINKYFITKTTRKYADGSAIYALFVERYPSYKTELVEGIQEMHINYSILNETELIDLPASDIHDWSKVAGVTLNIKIFFPPITKILHLYVPLQRSYQ